MIRPFSLPYLIKRLRPSMTSMNSRGDKGQPCLMPLDAPKNFEGVPLTSTAEFVDVKHPIIQLTLIRGTPI